jgi:hypothetical protein
MPEMPNGKQLLLREVAESLLVAETMANAIVEDACDVGAPDSIINDVATVHGRISHAQKVLAKLHKDYSALQEKARAEAIERAGSFHQD